MATLSEQQHLALGTPLLLRCYSSLPPRHGTSDDNKKMLNLKKSIELIFKLNQETDD